MLWWLILCVNLTELRGPQISDKTLLAVSVSVLPKEFKILISRLNKAIRSLKDGKTSSNVLTVWINHRERKGKFCLFLSWDVHILLTSDIRDPASQAFRLQNLTLITLNSQALDWELHLQFPWFSDLEFGLNYTTSFPGSPACSWKIVVLQLVSAAMWSNSYNIL